MRRRRCWFRVIDVIDVAEAVDVTEVDPPYLRMAF